MAGLLADDEEPKARKGLLDRAKETITYGILDDLWQGATLPGDVWYGKVDPNSDEALARTVNGLADLAPLSALKRAAPNTLYMFLGPSAKNADHAALKAAKAMDEAGESARKIWDETGWFRGADSKWRFEIDDSAADLKPRVKEQIAAGKDVSTNISGGFDHPELYRAYDESMPLMGDYDVGSVPEGYRAVYDPDTDGIRIHRDRALDARESTLHELQHAVQSREGFARGGNWSSAVADDLERLNARQSELWRATKDLPEQTAKDDWWNSAKGWKAGAKYDDYPGPVTPEMVEASEVARRIEELRKIGADSYPRLAGEVEARNVQARKDMTPAQRRATPPWETMDVPMDQQIVRGAADVSDQALEEFMARWLAGQGA